MGDKMPRKDRDEQMEYQKEYYRERYRNDEEFRERVKAFVRKSERKRRKKGIVWQQQNPDFAFYYLKGYRRGMKRAREVVCDLCKKLITEAIWHVKGDNI